MSPQRKDTILTFAILPAFWVPLFTGWDWWDDRSLAWHERAWYAALPLATALAAFTAGAALGWLYARSTSR